MRETAFQLAVKRQTAAKEREARAEWLATFRAALTGLCAWSETNGTDSSSLDVKAAHDCARQHADLMHGDVGPKP